MIGSRHYRCLDNVTDVMDWIEQKMFCLGYSHIKWFSGGALGVDTRVRLECQKRKNDFTEIKPDFTNGYNISKYFERNDLIVNKVNVLVAFWDGSSHGTYYTISRASRLGKTVLTILDKPVNLEMLEI